MNEAYFRIPKDKDKEKIFQYISIVLESRNRHSEKGDDILFESKLYESNSGYKYQIGWCNDAKIGIKDESKNIFCIAHRYLPESDLEIITKSICVLHGLEYIYNLPFENKLSFELEKFLSLFNKKSSHSLSIDYFPVTRKLINNFLKQNNLPEESLKTVHIQDTLIEYIKNDIKIRRMSGGKIIL